LAVRFQSHHKTRNYLARGEQRRLLVLVLLLGGVFLLMHHASKPSSWYWFVALSRPVATAPSEAVDTRLALVSHGDDLPGTIHAPSEKPPIEPGGRPVIEGVRPESLATIKDDTVFRGAEHEAFFHLLQVLDRRNEQTLARASLGRIAFVQLYKQPDEYRGRIVSLHGTVHRATRLAAAKNEFGIDHYYQLWLQPYDAPGSPLVVYVLDLPERFPTGAKIREVIECEAFFFKRWAYQAQDAIRSTPLLLAKNVRWTPPPAGPAPIDWKTIVSLLTGGLAIGGLVLWFALRGGQPTGYYAGRHPPRQETFYPEKLAELAGDESSHAADKLDGGLPQT
jgi:hypothetical protein